MRRGLLTLILLFPASSRAGDVSSRRAAKPAQIVLPFAAASGYRSAPKVPAQPPAAFICPAAQPPALVAAALRDGDAHGFFKAAVEAGYDPPDSDDRQQNLLAEGASMDAALRAAARRLSFDGRGDAASAVPAPEPPRSAGKPPVERGRAAKFDYENFGRLIALSPWLSEQPLRDTEAKRRILASCGYTHLFGPGGRRIPLAIADETRVGLAFANTLKAHRRRIARPPQQPRGAERRQREDGNS